MAVETLSNSAPSVLTWRPLAGLRPVLWHIAAYLRLRRRVAARRALLAQVLAQTSDPRRLADAGLRAPGPSIMELWAQELMGHRR